MLKVAGIILLSSVLFGHIFAFCPPEILTRPCTCINTAGNYLRCENITGSDVLNGIFRRTTGAIFSHLHFVNGSLEWIPADALVTKQIQTIGIVNSSLTNLFDKTPSPLNILRAISLQNVSFKNPFPWNQLKPLKKFELFLAVGVKIPFLDSSFKNNVNKDLKYFTLSNTSTECFVDGVLSDFSKLEDVRISKNPLKTFKRNFFPRPSNIIVLDLSENQIESLPSDAFADMGQFQGLDLSNNKLSTIEAGVFSGINHRLSYLHLDDNPLNCDCGLYWLISNKPKYEFTGKCATPENLKGKQVKDLEISDLGSCH